MANNRTRAIGPDYVDALFASYGLTIGELISAAPVALPLDPISRPDRHGTRVGET